ncbi:hypothetical protein ACFQ4K_09965 [Tistrella bauzanensis]
MDSNMMHAGQENRQMVTRLGGRALWRTPVLAQFDIAAHTEFTNCGTGDDDVICQSDAS